MGIVTFRGSSTIKFYPDEWKRQEFGRADGISAEDGKFNANWRNAVGVKFFHMVVSKDEYREQIQLVKGLGPDTTVEFAPV